MEGEPGASGGRLEEHLMAPPGRSGFAGPKAGAGAVVRLLAGSVRALVADATAWRLAWRNAGRNRRRTGIVVTAVAVGLAGSLVTMALNFGFIFHMVETVISTELGHVQVHAAGFDVEPGLERRIGAAESLGEGVIGTTEGVRAWAPRVRNEGLVFSARASAGVALVAIDPEREAEVSVLGRSIVAGDYLDGEPRRLLLGQRLADRLEVGVGDKLVVSSQDVSGDMTGEAFRVGGIFRTPSAGLDEGTLFVRLEEGRRMLGLGDEVSEFVVLARDFDRVGELGADLAGVLGDRYEVRTWEQLQPVLVYMIDMFESMAWIIYGAVFVAMAFGIANVLLMSVHERFREIGVLAAIGMSPARLVAMIVAEGTLVSALGVLVGLAVAGAALFLMRGGIDLSFWAEGLNSFGIPSTLVPVLRLSDLWTPLWVAAVTAVAASLWPALRAARIRPADAARHV
jgi:ABC-type lipoprotein release transport system permease subunit